MGPFDSTLGGKTENICAIRTIRANKNVKSLRAECALIHATTEKWCLAITVYDLPSPTANKIDDFKSKCFDYGSHLLNALGRRQMSLQFQ